MTTPVMFKEIEGMYPRIWRTLKMLYYDCQMDDNFEKIDFELMGFDNLCPELVEKFLGNISEAAGSSNAMDNFVNGDRDEVEELYSKFKYYRIAKDFFEDFNFGENNIFGDH